MLLRQINATEADVQLYGRLAGSVLYANSALRAAPGLLLKEPPGSVGPLGLFHFRRPPHRASAIEDQANIDLVRQLIQAHAYWRLKGLAVDLVIWNEDHAGYRQALHELIMGLIAAGAERQPDGQTGRHLREICRPDSRGGPYPFPGSGTGHHHATARGRCEQIDRRGHCGAALSRPWLRPARLGPTACRSGVASPEDLVFFNGLGGFTPDGREYVISTGRGQVTPAPWVNVLANAHFGTMVSESGPAYTWSENAHEFRLTPWYNDPVSDAAGRLFTFAMKSAAIFGLPCRSPPGAHALCNTARIRLHGVRTQRARDRLGDVDLCSHGCARQVHGIEGVQPDGPSAEALCHRDTWNGYWETCGRNQ